MRNIINTVFITISSQRLYVILDMIRTLLIVISHYC